MSEQSSSAHEPTSTAKAGHAVDPGRYEDFLNPGERILLESRQHPLMLAGVVLKGLALIVVCVAAFVLLGNWNALSKNVENILQWLLLIPIVLFLPGVIWAVISWSRARLCVTTEKVLFTHGVLNRQVETTPLVKVDEMTVEQPIFGRMFKYGKLLVNDPGNGQKRPLYDLHYVVDPAKAYRLITETARMNRAYEGGANPASYPHA